MEARNSPSQKKKEPTDENLDSLQPSQLLELLPKSDSLKENYILGLLLSNTSKIAPDDLVKLLTYNANRKIDTESKLPVQDTLLQKILEPSTLHQIQQPQHLLAVLPYVTSASTKEWILGRLFADCKANRLNGVQLLQLMKYTFESPPRPEIQQIMNTLYQLLIHKEQQEAERAAQKASEVIGLVLPQGWGEIPSGSCNTRNVFFVCDGCAKEEFVGTRYHCLQCQEYDLCENCYSRSIVTKSHQLYHSVTAIVQPLQIFQKLPDANDYYYIDVKFTGRLQTQAKQESNASVILLRNLQPSTGAAVYLSLPPYKKENSTFIGALTSEHPSLQLPYPLPKIGAVQNVRIGVIFMSVEKLDKIVQPVEVKPVHEQSAITPTRAVSNEVVVCFGETHPFRLDEFDTFQEVLFRAAKRWNLNVDEFEIQDENYKTFKLEDKVLPTMSKYGTAVLRLVRKTVRSQGPVFPAWNPTPNAPPPSVFPTSPINTNPLFRFQ